MGKHSKPSATKRNIARTVLGLGVIGAGFSTVQTPAVAGTPEDLEIIAQCESGNRNINNSTYPKSSASGYFQIIDGTWKRYGGTEFSSRAIGATREQQKAVAARIAAGRGSYADWNPSKHCWGGKVGKPAASAPKHSSPRAAPQSDRPRHAAPVGKRGTYTCDNGHLKYELCDPDTLGQVLPYPVRPGEELKATVGGRDRGTYVCTEDKLFYDACDPDTLGKTVKYPNRKR